MTVLTIYRSNCHWELLTMNILICYDVMVLGASIFGMPPALFEKWHAGSRCRCRVLRAENISTGKEIVTTRQRKFLFLQRFSCLPRSSIRRSLCSWPLVKAFGVQDEARAIRVIVHSLPTYMNAGFLTVVSSLPSSRRNSGNHVT